jgi:signal transduction histidine kinase
MHRQGITLYLIRDGRPDTPGLPARIVRRIAKGNDVHGVANVAGAREMARSLRKAAAAANRLSAGDRSVRMVSELPAETEELANAFNALAVNLERNEGRQRKFLLSISYELRTPLTTLKG